MTRETVESNGQVRREIVLEAADTTQTPRPEGDHEETEQRCLCPRWRSYDALWYQTKNGCATLFPDTVTKPPRETTRKEEGSLGSYFTLTWLNDFGPAERQCIIGECALDPTQPIAAQKQWKGEGTEAKCSPHVTLPDPLLGPLQHSHYVPTADQLRTHPMTHSLPAALPDRTVWGNWTFNLGASSGNFLNPSPQQLPCGTISSRISDFPLWAAVISS